MISQIQILPEPSAAAKEKGDFFESLLRSVLETQRYQVVERVNFTGTEIDLLCQHLDRPGDTALVECKARSSILSADVKNFAYDVLVSNRAKYGLAGTALIFQAPVPKGAAPAFVVFESWAPRTQARWADHSKPAPLC